MAVVGRIRRRLAIAIVLTALIPVLVAIWLADKAIRQTSERFFIPEVGVRLDQSLELYQELAHAVKSRMRAEAAEIAAHQALRDGAAQENAAAVRALLSQPAGDATALASLGLRAVTPDSLGISYRKNLRNFVPPYVLSMVDMDVAAIERHMFMASYKGLTDIVTKWVWPAPARAAVRLCTRWGISPNAVTTTSVALVIVATWLFWHGHYGSGLVLAWLRPTRPRTRTDVREPEAAPRPAVDAR